MKIETVMWLHMIIEMWRSWFSMTPICRPWKVRNILELGEFCKVQKFQSLSFLAMSLNLKGKFKPFSVKIQRSQVETRPLKLLHSQGRDWRKKITCGSKISGIFPKVPYIYTLIVGRKICTSGPESLKITLHSLYFWKRVLGIRYFLTSSRIFLQPPVQKWWMEMNLNK